MPQFFVAQFPNWVHMAAGEYILIVTHRRTLFASTNKNSCLKILTYVYTNTSPLIIHRWSVCTTKEKYNPNSTIGTNVTRNGKNTIFYTVLSDAISCAFLMYKKYVRSLVVCVRVCFLLIVLCIWYSLAFCWNCCARTHVHRIHIRDCFGCVCNFGVCIVYIYTARRSPPHTALNG